MNLKKITLEKEGEKQAQELVAKLYSVCAGEPLPVVLFALRDLKQIVQLSSKVLTREEVNEFYGKTEDDLAGKADQEPAR